MENGNMYDSMSERRGDHPTYRSVSTVDATLMRYRLPPGITLPVSDGRVYDTFMQIESEDLQVRQGGVEIPLCYLGISADRVKHIAYLTST